MKIKKKYNNTINKRKLLKFLLSLEESKLKDKEQEENNNKKDV